jgi:hypothetical protein
MKTAVGPPELEKYYVGVSRTGMHYVTHRSTRMQKHMFDVMCPSALFIKSILVPPEHEKYSVDVWRCTGMHYVTHRSHKMQKHKFSVMCLGALFMETTPGPSEHKK